MYSKPGLNRSILDPRCGRRNQFGEERGSEIHFGQRRGHTPQAARLPDSGQGHEWVRLYSSDPGPRTAGSYVYALVGSSTGSRATMFLSGYGEQIGISHGFPPELVDC